MDFIDNTGKPPSLGDLKEAEVAIRSAMTLEMTKVMVASPGLAVQLPNIFRCLRMARDLLNTDDSAQDAHIDQLLKEIEALHEELEALKNQRRWELYLVITEKVLKQHPDFQGYEVNSFAREVDAFAKQYVNAVLPKE
jgi:hypothetical protein